MLNLEKLSKRQRDLADCMEATWEELCHPFYQLGFRPSDKTREMEEWVMRIYCEVLDGTLKLEDYRSACNDLINAIESVIGG